MFGLFIAWGKSLWNMTIIWHQPGPLFTKKTPSYGYRNPHDKPKTAWRPSQVYNGNPYTDKTVFSYCIEAQYSLILQGFLVCMVGPSLLDLQITANTDTKSIAMVFIGRAIGGATGAVLFATVLSRCHPWRILGAAYIAMATSLTSLPWIGHVIGVTAMYGLGGMGYCIADAGELALAMELLQSCTKPSK